MPFIPHTQDDINAMLSAIDVQNIDALFDEIPEALQAKALSKLAPGMNELEVTRSLMKREPAIKPGTCFIGAGAYEHHIPAAVWEIASRGEFYSAYTPYQAEASQGTLQLIYEYQSIMCHLLGMDVSNASMYDGATALVESVLMAIRIKRGKATRVVVPTTLHPRIRDVFKTFLLRQDIELEEWAYCTDSGQLDLGALDEISGEGLAAIIIPQPNFFGVLEDVNAINDKAKALGAVTIAYVNPVAMALLKEPGDWGSEGVDIVCGEGQPLGVPLASGGPYFGFMCCRKAHVRQMPGRIVGRTEDDKGNTGYVLTLQAREQHIRRSKATSNICTNQGLMVTAATIYMSLLGSKGLQDVAIKSHQNTKELQQLLLELEGVESVFSGAFFHEFVIKFTKPVQEIWQKMSDAGLQAGYVLQDDYPTLENSLLVCVTETKTQDDINDYVNTLKSVLDDVEA